MFVKTFRGIFDITSKLFLFQLKPKKRQLNLDLYVDLKLFCHSTNRDHHLNKIDRKCSQPITNFSLYVTLSIVFFKVSPNGTKCHTWRSYIPIKVLLTYKGVIYCNHSSFVFFKGIIKNIRQLRKLTQIKKDLHS